MSVATAFGAVPSGVDLAQHAKQLLRVHDAVLGGVTPPRRPRALVARSWQRVMSMGLDPDGHNERSATAPADLEARRRQSPLALVIDELRLVLTSAAEASQFLMVVCDGDGVILWREGSSKVRRQADRLGFAAGARWTERAVGTNAIGTALAEAAPVQLFSAEHFEQTQHPWYCTAAPVHDPRTGELIGVVDVSGPALTLHPAIGALVDTAVRLAEERLWRRHQQRLSRLRQAVEPVVSGVSGPLLVVDEHGWVAHHAGVAERERIEVPQDNRALAVPGLGLCVPERLEHGWLVRPNHDRTAIHAHLDAAGTLTLQSDGAPWRTRVTRRHAQILTLLAGAGVGGRTAAQLSRALYGDDEHLVTVRAEVSRLRRVVGALVATNPYRIADGATLTVTR